MVLVDTSVWSLALRREPKDLNPEQKRIVAEWFDLVQDGWAWLIGPIRQEILSGVRHKQQFATLEGSLSGFPDAPIEAADYVEAARFFNICRERGVTGTPVDLLICAVACRAGWPIFSVDHDFERYAKLLPIRLHRHGHTITSP
jgi:predicted nucleic acid-binding protein